MALGVPLPGHFPLELVASLRYNMSSSLTLWSAVWRRHGSPTVSAPVSCEGLHHAASRPRTPAYPDPQSPRGAARRRGPAADHSAPDWVAQCGLPSPCLAIPGTGGG